VAALPPARESWLVQTYDAFVPPSLDMPAADTPPEIPLAADGAYTGEELNLAEVNLGAYLASKRRLAPRVVLHLTGAGEFRTDPIHIKGSTLVLYFPPHRSEAGRPLLMPQNGRDRDALIEVEDGGLEILNGGIRFDNARSLSMPACLLKVHGGDLRLVRVRLQGPLGQVPTDYRGLIDFQGSGDPARDGARECVLSGAVLLSGRTGLHTRGAGTRVRLQQCVIVAGTEAFRFDPDPARSGRLNVHCLLDHTTVAAREAVIRLGDSATAGPLLEPILVQSRDSLFLAPFAAGPAAMLVGEGDALARGLLIWRGDGNGYDKRLQGPAYSVWSNLWGPNGNRQPSSWALPARPVDLDDPDLSGLALPAGPRTTRPGADLEQLGITAKGVRSP
jgi:hypothetical protein